jgi:ketol-acid reductoisomerase
MQDDHATSRNRPADQRSERPLPVLRGDADCPIEPLRGRRIALLGFGNQGRAHALNLRDSGLEVVVCGRSPADGGRGTREAAALGFPTAPAEDAVASADLVVCALPDEAHANAYDAVLGRCARPGATIGFLHGFSVHYGLVRPRTDLGVVLVAPKGPGTTLRERYAEGLGIPGLVAVAQENGDRTARSFALAWANGIGCARAGVLETTFAAETETDLFGEQTVLCGGLAGLVVAAYETLVEAGYPPELAYIECCHEVKQVADLVYARGLAGMRAAISNTAEFGSFEAEAKVAGPAVRAVFASILAEIRDGSFARRLVADHADQDRWLNERRRLSRQHPIEETGERVRSLMPWLRGSEPPAP